jgi:hypothetical protein
VNQFPRRNFLKSAALLAGASTLGFGTMFGLNRASAADGDSPQTIIDLAATAETFACTHYHQALTSGLRFTKPQLDYLKAALEQELIHLEFLNANGAKALADSFFFPTGTFKSTKSFANVTAIAETVFVGAYLAATRRFAELGNSLLAATAAQVAVIEGQHLALVRQTGLELPNNVALGEPKFFNISEAVPVLQPVLDGVQGGLGPMEKASVKYPGPDAIRKVVGRSNLAPVKAFVDPSAFPSQAATPVATAAPTAAPTEAK